MRLWTLLLVLLFASLPAVAQPFGPFGPSGGGGISSGGTNIGFPLAVQAGTSNPLVWHNVAQGNVKLHIACSGLQVATNNSNLILQVGEGGSIITTANYVWSNNWMTVGASPTSGSIGGNNVTGINLNSDNATTGGLSNVINYTFQVDVDIPITPIGTYSWIKYNGSGVDSTGTSFTITGATGLYFGDSNQITDLSITPSSNWVGSGSCQLLQLVAFVSSPGPSYGTNKYILGNDLAGDIDNAAQLKLTNILHLNGTLSLQGIIACDSSPYSASAIKAFENFYNLGSIPIYAYQGNDLPTTDVYAQLITNKFNPGDSRANYQSETVGYRTLLHAASVGGYKVVINESGPLKCLDNLINSTADGIDPRNGVALMQATVAAVHFSTVGYYPSNAAFSCNPAFNIDPTAAGLAAAIDLIPKLQSAGITVVDVGLEQTTAQCSAGNAILTNPIQATGPPTVTSSATNPYLDAFNDASSQLINGKRPAWGELSTLLMGGVSGATFSYNTGTFAIDSSGNNIWTTGGTTWYHAQSTAGEGVVTAALSALEWP